MDSKKEPETWETSARLIEQDDSSVADLGDAPLRSVERRSWVTTNLQSSGSSGWRVAVDVGLCLNRLPDDQYQTGEMRK